MRPIQRKSMLAAIVITLFAPVIGTIIFIRRDYVFELMFFDLICFCILVIVYIFYIIKEHDKKFKYIVVVFVPSLVILLLAFYGPILSIASYYDFNFVHKENLIDLLNEVKTEKFEMIHVTRNNEKVDQSIYPSANIGISMEKLEIIRKKMVHTDISYINRENSIIYFTNGGFIDSESGYAFCENEVRPSYNHSGTVYTWDKVDDNWYYWYAD